MTRVSALPGGLGAQGGIRDLAKKRPVTAFLVATFAWSWLFWLAAIPLAGQRLLLTSVVMIGGFGPALAAVVVLGLRSDAKPDVGRRRLGVMALSSAVVFGVMALRYVVGNVAGYETLAADLTLTAPVVLGAIAASLVGGWVISSAVSRNAAVSERMGSLIPTRLNLKWTAFALAFYPVMILSSWGLALLLGSGVEYPGLWGRPLLATVPYYALTFVLVLLAQGGNEEPGWRGFLQPEAQRRMSPLNAALLVALFWSLWHLPLYLNGFYADELVGGMLGGGVFRILLSIFLAWFYRHSGGDLFLTSVLHASFNVMPNFLPTSDLGLLVLWLIVAIAAVVSDKMWRREPVRSRDESTGSRKAWKPVLDFEREEL